MENIDKLVLGTVQFGMNYGINNHDGQVKNEELVKILDVCRKEGINCFDTAFDYGNSEERLGEYFSRHKDYVPHIISKYSQKSMPLLDECQKSLDRLRVNVLYAYLVHNFSLYLDNPCISKDFRLLKDKGLVKKTGFSLYTLEELDYLLEHEIEFDIVEIPYNIFDRRFERYFSLLKERGKDIFVRSVFLQGLFFMDVENIPSKLKVLAPHLKKMADFATRKEISLRGICLNYVCSNPLIDGVLIGVDSAVQLLNNLKSIKVESIDDDCIEFINSICLNDEKMILPINW